MKSILTLALFCISICTYAKTNYYSSLDTLRVKNNKTKMTNKEVIDTAKKQANSIQSSFFDGVTFYNESKNKYLELRNFSIQSKLSISQELKIIRTVQSTQKKNTKIDYLDKFNVITGTSGLTKKEIDTEIRKLREKLKESSVGIRVNSNQEFRYVYYKADVRDIRILPARNARFSQLYYSELKDSSYLTFLRNQFLTFNEDFGALSSEIVAAYLGSIRVSLNTVISKASEIKIDTAQIKGLNPTQIQSLVNENYQENVANNTLSNVLARGGLMALKFQYPLLFTSPLWSPRFRFDNEIVGAISGQFNTAGKITQENETSIWGSLGLHNNAYIPLVNFKDDDSEFSAFGFFFQYNIERVAGSGTFYTNLNLTGDQREGFWFGEFRTGIFYKGVQITYSVINLSNKTLDGQFTNTFRIAYAPK